MPSADHHDLSLGTSIADLKGETVTGEAASPRLRSMPPIDLHDLFRVEKSSAHLIVKIIRGRVGGIFAVAE